MSILDGIHDQMRRNLTLEYGLRLPIRPNGKSLTQVGMLFGMRIITNPLCRREVPVREHKERFRTVSYSSGLIKQVQVPACRGNYHKRIQKKWIKRYGTKVVDEFFMLGKDTVVMHPDTLATINNIFHLGVYNER
jgi:hypothetical protein